MKPQARALLATILLTAPFAQADNAYDESALYNETYTQSLNVGSEAIDCLKARKNDCGQKAWESSLDSIGKVIDTPSGQRALEELLPQLDTTGTINKQNSRAIVNVLREQLPAAKKNGKPISKQLDTLGNRASQQLTQPLQDKDRTACMNKGDSLLSGVLRCGANAMIDNLQK
ncbi:hypothetical protein [Kingella oralis]|uniref:hypothetical protein n=1 Tax=Kingella oralis TaxID=505 RepID=UPI0034E3B2E8